MRMHKSTTTLEKLIIISLRMKLAKNVVDSFRSVEEVLDLDVVVFETLALQPLAIIIERLGRRYFERRRFSHLLIFRWIF